MGYRKMPNVDLMISLFGRPYIDVRNSVNSFLPAGLSDEISEKIVNAYIERLDEDPHLHDKIEFDVVVTSYDFQIDKVFNERYKNILTKKEQSEYKSLLKELTINAIKNKKEGSLSVALNDIISLKNLQKTIGSGHSGEIMFLIDKIKTLIEQCKRYGTLPFSIIARHAFIAESLLDHLSNQKQLVHPGLMTLKKSFNTIAGDMTNDLHKLKKIKSTKKSF